MSSSFYCRELVKLHADLSRKSTRRLTPDRDAIKGHPIYILVGHRKFTPLSMLRLLDFELSDEVGLDLFPEAVRVALDVDGDCDILTPWQIEIVVGYYYLYA